MGTEVKNVVSAVGELSPNFQYEPRCKICRNREWGPKVTEALLRGVTWREIRDRYSQYFANGLRDNTLNNHFQKHCDRESLIKGRQLASADARVAFFERINAEGKELIDSAVAFDAIARNCFDDVMRKNEELDWLNTDIEFYGGERIFNVDILGHASFPEAALILNDRIELQMRGIDYPGDLDESPTVRRDRILNSLTHRRSQVAKEKDSSIKALIDSLYKRERVLGKDSGGPQINFNILQLNFQSFLDSTMRVLQNSVPDPTLRNILIKKISDEMDSYFSPLLEGETE